ncbi:AcrR family transcriptional regulator [Amorphus suaedae]
MSEAAAPRPRRSTARHRRILDAATACVVRDGYAATTIEAVAAAAGAGKQTIYRWWPTKAALYVEVYTDIVSREALTAPAAGPAIDRLTAMLRQLFRLYRETPAGAILAGLVGASPADPTTREAVAEGLVLGRADLVGAIVETAVAHGEIRGSAAVANEIVVAVVWKRLAMDPDSLTDAFAGRLAAIAIAAAEADSHPEDPI